MHICIVFQAQSIVVPNAYKKRTDTSRYSLPGSDENFANLCTEKLKSTIVDNKYIKYPMQAL